MSEGADPQMTLRDYFSEHGGVEHVLIANIQANGCAIEFYIKPIGMKEVNGMHFSLSMSGKITEIGAWEGQLEEVNGKANN